MLHVYNASCLWYTTCNSVQSHRHLCNVADAKWLASSFFRHYSGALAHPDVALTNPADAAFLTQAALDKLDWTQQTFCGDAWKQSVQAALKQISIEDYYKMSMQRFQQALSSVGIYAAGMYRAWVHLAWFFQHITRSGDQMPCYDVLSTTSLSSMHLLLSQPKIQMGYCSVQS